MRIGQALYRDGIGRITVIRKKHNPVNNKVEWLGRNGNKEVVLNGSEVLFSDYIAEKTSKEKKIKEKAKDKESKDNVSEENQSNIKKLAEKDFDVRVMNFPKQEKLEGLLKELKIEIANIETDITVKNDMRPISNTVAKIQVWQKATIDAIRDIPEAEFKDYSRELKSLEKTIKENKVDLSNVESSLITLSKTEYDKKTVAEIKNSVALLNNIEELIKGVENYEIPSDLISKGRIKVEVDRISGGSGGPSIVGLKNTDDEPISPATEANQDSLSRYQTADFDSLSDPVYIGSLDEDGKWYIKRICISSEMVDYAKGDSDYATSWAGRAGLTYGDFNNIF